MYLEDGGLMVIMAMLAIIGFIAGEEVGEARAAKKIRPLRDKRGRFTKR